MKSNNSKHPNRKISETFLDFSSPLLDALGKAATKQQVEKALQITYTVWNSIVLDSVKGGSKYISMVRQSMKDNPESSALIEQLILRKKTFFENDLRLIGDYSIKKKREGDWRLRAEARDLLISI